MYNTLMKVHKTSTKDNRFINYENKYSPFFENFMKYAEYISFRNGKVSKNSNKAGSYKNALIRIAMAYEELYSEQISDFTSLDTYKKLKIFDSYQEFKKFNRERSNFYSAALTSYLAYLRFLNEKIEDEYDFSDIDILVKEENPEYVIEKKKKLVWSFDRNVSVINIAKYRDEYTCQYDKNHKTFKTIQGKNYVEVLHLVPLSAQKLFDDSIDILENVICLCPNCYAKIHFSDYSIREKMLNHLYDIKTDDFERANIKIDKKELKSLYQIL